MFFEIVYPINQCNNFQPILKFIWQVLKPLESKKPAVACIRKISKLNQTHIFLIGSTSPMTIFSNRDY